MKDLTAVSLLSTSASWSRSVSSSFSLPLRVSSLLSSPLHYAPQAGARSALHDPRLRAECNEVRRGKECNRHDEPKAP